MSYIDDKGISVLLTIINPKTPMIIVIMTSVFHPSGIHPGQTGYVFR